MDHLLETMMANPTIWRPLELQRIFITIGQNLKNKKLVFVHDDDNKTHKFLEKKSADTNERNNRSRSWCSAIKT